MSAQDSIDFSSRSGGPHPTMAGNVLDPNVGADAQKAGKGVGATDESTIKDEAREHIEGRSSGHGQGSSGLGQDQSYGQGSSGLGQGQSYGQGSSGIGQGQSYGSGGQGFDTGSSVNRSEYNEPSATRQHDEGIDYIRGASGLDSEAGRGTGLDQNSGVASGVAEGATGVGHSETGAGYGSSRDTDRATRDSTTAADTTSAGSQLQQGTAQSGEDVADSAGKTGSSRGTTDTNAGAGTGGGSSAKSGAGATDDDSRGGPPPNIPTAGGERIGTKHWGESKVIPDNPPRRPDENKAGVSSSAGQPDDLTQSNTNKNTGSATQPGSSNDTGKESFIDKIKDKLTGSHK